MPVDTLAAFRATKEVVRTHLIERTGYQCQDEAIRVLVYQYRWYIEELEPEPGHLVFPRYYLITERDSYVSSDLGDLETKLYLYARESEGAAIEPCCYECGSTKKDVQDGAIAASIQDDPICCESCESQMKGGLS